MVNRRFWGTYGQMMRKRYGRFGIVIGMVLLVGNLCAQVSVQGVTANGKPLSYRPNQPIRLDALDNDVTFTFRAKPGSVYQYKLEGFDRQWINSQYPIARYTNLDGNEYVLAVRTLQGNRVVGQVRVRVSVERELTEEWWFVPAILVYAVLLLGAAMYFFMLYNFRQKLKVQSIRYRIAADLHDEVGATLSSIAMATNMVKRKMDVNQADVVALLDTIKTDSEETIHTIRDTVWTINPDNDSPDKLFEKMRSFAFQVLTARDIALQFENQIPFDKSLKISMEQRRNLYLIFKEAINNIAKHSQATKVQVLISRSATGLHWLIADNGIGFNLIQQTGGNGLKNFRNRAAESFMDLTIDTSSGSGCRISIVVPEL